MDGARFDSLARSLTDADSRRGVLRGLLAGSIGLVVWAEADDAAAKNCKKIKNRKKRKKCLAASKCIGTCAGKLCGDDGCGKPCGVACSGRKTCQSGACACPSDLPLYCPDGCGECCFSDDCGVGKNCVEGRCVVPPVTALTCPPGADNCEDGFPTPCRSDFSCICMLSMTNETRCAGGKDVPNVGCPSCATDAECATLHPDIPGVFCAKGGSGCCPGFCVAPCPSLAP